MCVFNQFFFRCFLLLGVILVLQSCTYVDNYMLGKDNTPKPAPLKPIKTKVALSENWSVPAGKNVKSKHYFKLQPVVVNDLIYTADASGLVQAVHQQTGQRIWSRQLNKAINSGPYVGNGSVVVGTNSASVISLFQTDGRQKWESKLSGDILSKPVISGNKVIAKTVNGRVYGLNVQNGDILWSSDHGAPSLILKAGASPVVFKNLVLVGFSDGKLDAIDIESGNLVWQRGLAYANGSSDVERLVDIDADPVVLGDRIVLASYQGYIGALSLHDGQFLWRKPASTYRNLAVDHTTVYMTDSDDVVWAFNQSDGQVKWKQADLKARGLTDPVLLKGRIALGDETGIVHLLSTQTGAVVSRKSLGAPIYINPTAAHNKLYVMAANGRLNQLSVS